MPTAKTYANMKIEGEPFKENGRMYVNVVVPKGLKKVRWYSEAEYKRMYPEAIPASNFNARNAFGFGDNGFITIYQGKEDEVCAWARAEWPPKAYYNTTFHFYTPSDIPVENVPDTITPIKLTWDEVKVNDTQMKSHEEVNKYVMDKIIPAGLSKSQYQGAENEWLEKEVVVVENKTSETHFGEKHIHSMYDAEGNKYIWETGAKSLACDVAVKLKMKVKAHKEINNEKCTIVWYCKVI